MVEEKKERRKEEKKEREERVGGESVPCTSTAAEASDRRPSWTCTSAAHAMAAKAAHEQGHINEHEHKTQGVGAPDGIGATKG